MSERVALYPGSFDPPTYGHLDLIQRATHIFDKLVVAIAMNRSKDSLFTTEERLDMLRALTADQPKVEVTSFPGLTAEFAGQCGAVAILRGLRAISDFEFEHSMALTNRKINPNVDTVCLMPSEAYLFLSSRVVKEIARFGGEVESFVPPLVAQRLYARLAERAAAER